MERPASKIEPRVDDEGSTVPPLAVVVHGVMNVTSVRPTQFVDITDRVSALVASSRRLQGIVNVQALHTTTAILINEHEPLLLRDFETSLNRWAPAEGSYRHDDRTLRVVNLTADERRNGHAHCRALLLSTSACINVVDGRLMLGRWQRIFFVELDGPQDRLVSTMLLGFGGVRR
jgi:secondary thiamine-phosphate synthase enzyme